MHHSFKYEENFSATSEYFTLLKKSQSLAAALYKNIFIFLQSWVQLSYTSKFLATVKFTICSAAQKEPQF